MINKQTLLNRICAFIFAALATAFSWGGIAAVLDGRVEELSKYNKGRILLLEQTPFDFWMATGFYFLMASMFWYFSFWVYQNRIKDGVS